MSNKKSIWGRIGNSLSSIGPGLFLVGYSIGTGSVIAMASAGSRYGMSFLWALALSCIFSFFLLEAYGRYAIVTGEGALYGYKQHFEKFGKPVALITLVGLVVVEILALIGIMGVVCDLMHEISIRLFGGLGWNPVYIAFGVIIFLYLFLLTGKYSSFEKFMIVFVSIMGISFLISMFVVFPEPESIIDGLIPNIPDEQNAPMIIAALVGTTLTAPTFVVRSMLMKEKKWSTQNAKLQTKEAFVAALLMFIISGSIMACAAGTLYIANKPVEDILTMVSMLEPFLGRLALSVFIMGIFGAALSSVFPIAMLAPLLISDYENKPVVYKGSRFRILTGIALLFGLIVPVFGFKSVFAMLISQLFQIFVLPIVVISIMYLLNKESIMGKYKAGFWLNLGLFLTLIFSFYISYQSARGFIESSHTIF